MEEGRAIYLGELSIYQIVPSGFRNDGHIILRNTNCHAVFLERDTKALKINKQNKKINEKF